MPSEKWIGDLERDGFVVVEDFFGAAEVAQARAEIAPLCNPAHEGAYEYLINIFGKSPTVDRMVERILTDPESKKLMQALAGPHVKLRGYNVRRMTGEFDPSDNLNPAMDWHRDAPGEFCLAIFIEEPMDAENAGTAAIPGSHWLPYDPRWNCMFGSPFIWLDAQKKIRSGLSVFKHLNPFSRALAKRAQKRATAISGKPGDFYIFVNDIWHGRCPNLYGKKGMVVMIGGFPTDIPYPDSVPPPSGAVLAKLPPRLQAAAAQSNPVQPGQKSLLHRLAEHRRTAKPAGLFLLAQIERRVAEVITRILLPVVSVCRRLASPLKRAVYAASWKLWSASPLPFKNAVRRAVGRSAKQA